MDLLYAVQLVYVRAARAWRGAGGGGIDGEEAVSLCYVLLFRFLFVAVGTPYRRPDYW